MHLIKKNGIQFFLIIRLISYQFTNTRNEIIFNKKEMELSKIN